jgi:hypothetical protein
MVAKLVQHGLSFRPREAVFAGLKPPRVFPRGYVDVPNSPRDVLVYFRSDKVLSQSNRNLSGKAWR